MMGIYPWQQAQWQALQAQWQRLPHGILLHGPKDLGKYEFARILAQTLLCTDSNELAQLCGHCKSCHLLTANTHPDFICLEPEEEGKGIKVDQVRELVDSLNLTGQMSAKRVIVISPTESMNSAAANALLKTLEEPAPGVHLILVCHQLQRIVATIRSRCQLIRFYPSLDASTVAWLAERCPLRSGHEQALHHANGIPLLALSKLNGEQNDGQLLANNLLLLKSEQHQLFDIAKQWKDSSHASVLTHCLQITSQIIRYRMVGTCNYPEQQLIQQLSQGINLSSLFNYYRYLLNQAHRLSSSLNQQMLLEQLLVHWCELNRCKGEIYAC